MQRKYTLLYQNPTTGLRDWYTEIFGPCVDQVVDDGTHTAVLDDCIVSDSFVEIQDPAYYRRFRGRNAFLLLSPDEYYLAPIDVYRNFCGVFRSHFSGAYDPARVLQIPTGYQPGFRPFDASRPASERKYMWSFLGDVKKTTRPECLRSLIPYTPNYWYASDGWTPGRGAAPVSALRPRPTHQYFAIVGESAFTPCPMGNVSQESHRPFEALETGSIPVLEKRFLIDAHRSVLGDHPLPTFYSWKEAGAFMSRLWSTPAQLDALQRECLAWWAAYKHRLTERIGEFMSRLDGQTATARTRYIAAYARIPGWSLVELTRHHTPRALLRRLERQTRRFVTTGRILVRK